MSEQQIKRRLAELWAWVNEGRSPHDAPSTIESLIIDVQDSMDSMRRQLVSTLEELDDMRSQYERIEDERAYSPAIDQEIADLGVPTDLSIGQLLALKQHLAEFKF